MGGIAVDRCDMSSRNRGLGGPTGSVWFHGEHVVYLFSMQESVAPGLVAVRETPDAGIARHVEYAFTWFSLAATAFVLWVVLNVRRTR